MIKRGQTDAFNTGEYAMDQESEPIDKVTNRSQIKRANKKGTLREKDSLYNALSAPKKLYTATHKANLPIDNHRYSHSTTSRPRGALYSPAGQFGSISRTGAGKGVYSYGGNRHSAPSANAVPGRQNSRNGDNAVGHAPNRSGSNAVGYPPHRKGPNAVGNPPNRYGENALSGRFIPKGGGGKP